MKKLNAIVFDDLLGYGFEATYKNYKVRYCNSNIQLFTVDNYYLTSFICTTRKVYEFKNIIKNKINEIIKVRG